MDDYTSGERIKWLYLFAGLAVLVNFSGLFVTIIGPDGALYASIAKAMVIKGNYAYLMVEGKDWLDKPHFPFWMAALSFKIFGIATWSYKLPAVLFTLLAAFYTYKLAFKFYNKETALWSATILLTAQHIVISNMDVRAEPYLAGLIIASIYHFFKAQQRPWFWHLLAGSAFAACAVMTKGIFALIPVFGAIAGPLLLMKEWKALLNWRWILAFMLVLILIIPEIWCLHLQFDQHPEKVVFGQTGVSGIKFFFWDSQFGRFFNTGPIRKSGGDPAFFLHTILWAFLPWSLTFYIAVTSFFRKRARIAASDWLCICGAGITLLVLSASKFQLPHYIIILFPLFAIITAKYIFISGSLKMIKSIRIIQCVVLILMVLLVAAVHYFFRPALHSFAVFLLLVSCGTIVFALRPVHGRFRVFFLTMSVTFIVNIYFNTAYYPELVTYQADSEAAFWLNEHNAAHLPVVKVVNNFSYGLDFYTRQPVVDYVPGDEHVLPPKPYLLYAESKVIDQMKTDGAKLECVKIFENYRITRLKPRFLNRNTRKQLLDSSQIVLVR